jgi:ATP-dependent 26S proteasome regulatory subunit
MQPRFCPTQQRAFDGLQAALPVGNLFVLHGKGGSGRTVVLRAVHAAAGGAFVPIKDFVDAMRSQHPLALEETFERLVMEALKTHDLVVVDDLHLLTNVVGGCGNYPRTGFLEAPLTALAAHAAEAGKKLLFALDGGVPQALLQRCYSSSIDDLEADDYEFLCQTFLGPDLAARLDIPKIFRFASSLSAQQLKAACAWLKRDSDLDTERFIEYLRSQYLTSNVDLGEVQPVSLGDLKGVDEVIRSLETHIILPLENDALAADLHLKPKRGVLLAGPPGTGKTTVGRALAHRLKSKFFLVDGTIISGTSSFYGHVHWIFEQAKNNAPSIIFIDDSDVIFESGAELGLYRYLLTMLDGLESQSAGRVCVMMTAMDVGHLPPALLRSGRIELWLEMRLPNEEARAGILGQHLASWPPAYGELDTPRLVAATEGFTGADLKRLVEDGKNLLAYDKGQGLPGRPPTDYFLEAVAAVRANKERYHQAEERVRRHRPARPVYFDHGDGE